MKKLLILVVLLFITGCTSEYTLEIGNDSFKEEIEIIIDNSEIPNVDYIEEIEIDDQITPLIEQEQPAFFSKQDVYYNKKVVEEANYTNVILDYEFSEKEFKDSNTLNSCFEHYDFYTKDSYYIHAYGKFYCLHTDSFNINIKTNNKVILNNADSVSGNVYTWNVNEDNIDGFDLQFEVSKGINYKAIIKYLLIIVGLTVVILAIVYSVIKKNKNNNKI